MPPESGNQLEAWPTPEPLLAVSCPVAPFEPHSLLPGPFLDLVLSIAAELQIAPDLPAVALMIALAAAVGRRAFIKPKEFSDWKVVPNLWGLIVAPSGYMKSPCITRALKFLEDLQREAYRAFEVAIAQYGRDLAAFRSRPNATGDPPQEPRCWRCITSDTTVEKLHELLRGNPAGILVKRDELSGFFASLCKPSREGDRQFYLESWSGDSSFTMDRIGRGTIFVEHACVAIFGGIQPQRLKDFLWDAVRGGTTVDGFPQRFQLAVWPDQPIGYQYIDTPPDPDAERQVEEVFRRVISMSPVEPIEYRFDPDAQVLFIDWLAKLASGVTSKPAIRGHFKTGHRKPTQNI